MRGKESYGSLIDEEDGLTGSADGGVLDPHQLPHPRHGEAAHTHVCSSRLLVLPLLLHGRRCERLPIGRRSLGALGFLLGLIVAALPLGGRGLLALGLLLRGRGRRRRGLPRNAG